MKPVTLTFLPKNVLEAAVGNKEASADLLVGLMTDLAFAVAALTPTREANLVAVADTVEHLVLLNEAVVEIIYAEEAKHHGPN